MLHEEIWIKDIQENFYNNENFLKMVTDMSEGVEYNRLHIASAGLDPKVLIDNNTYPIGIVERVDIDNTILLKRFETENTIVKSLEAVELSYDKRESVMRQHRNTLINETAKTALHAYAPMRHTAETPLLKTTGEQGADGRKRLTIDDILELKVLFDMQKYPTEGRVLVLNPHHVTDLLRADINIFKNITDFKDGEPNKFAGFNIFTFADTPLYQGTTIENLNKIAYESTDTTKMFSSVAFIKSEVMKADGEVKLFVRENDPELRGDVIGFEKRFVASPIRNRGIGAIVSEQA